jgi:lysozyme family protein
MTNFERCVDFLLDLEGGFVDNAYDKGGPTKFGITLRALQNHRSTPVSATDVKNLSKEEASQIYLIDYWNMNRLGVIRPWRIALVIFCHVVHSGPISGFLAVQKTLNESFGQRLFLDGVFGVKTELALAMVKDEALFCHRLIQVIQNHYAEVCAKDYSQLRFLRGWMRRSFLIEDYVMGPDRQGTV